MTETLKQIRDYISDGRFIDAMNLLDEVMTDCQQLVTKCNELERKYERTEETLFEEEERIKSLLEENSELKQNVFCLKVKINEKEQTIMSWRNEAYEKEDFWQDAVLENEVLEKKLDICIGTMKTVIDNTDEFATKELLMNILDKVKEVK